MEFDLSLSSTEQMMEILPVMLEIIFVTHISGKDFATCNIFSFLKMSLSKFKIFSFLKAVNFDLIEWARTHNHAIGACRCFLVRRCVTSLCTVECQVTIAESNSSDCQNGQHILV